MSNKTGEASKKNMQEKGKYVIFKNNSIESSKDYGNNYQLIEKKGKDRYKTDTAAITVSTTTYVTGTASIK